MPRSLLHHVLFGSGAGSRRAWPLFVDPRERIHQRYFPDVTLRTHEGESVRLYEDLIRGRIVLLNFFYATCDGICPAVTRTLVDVHARLGDRAGREVFFRSFTLRPDVDTVAVLADYAKENGIGRGWDLLTAEPDTMERLRHSLGFVDPDPEVDAVRSSHTGMVRVGNEPETLWTACPGLVGPEAILRSLSAVARWPAPPPAVADAAPADP
jgi:protein SCO1/2